MKFKKILSRVEIMEGEIVPWYLGIAYWDYNQLICWILPINYLVRFMWRLNHVWQRIRLGDSWIDKKCVIAFRKGREREVENSKYEYEVCVCRNTNCQEDKKTRAKQIKD